MHVNSQKSATFDGICLKEVYAQAARAVAGLERAAKRKRPDGKLFDAARVALARLPYATDEFAISNRRLDNAVGYYLKGEFGAATYELAMLKRRLGREG